MDQKPRSGRGLAPALASLFYTHVVRNTTDGLISSSSPGIIIPPSVTPSQFHEEFLIFLRLQDHPARAAPFLSSARFSNQNPPAHPLRYVTFPPN